MDKRLRFMTDLIAPLRVAPGGEVRLSRDHDPGYTGGVARPQAAALANGVDLLADYQDRLAAQDTFGLLLVLQGLAAEAAAPVCGHQADLFAAAIATVQAIPGASPRHRRRLGMAPRDRRRTFSGMRRRWGTDRGGAAGTGQTALELAEGLETRQGQATAPLAVRDARHYSRQAHA